MWMLIWVDESVLPDPCDDRDFLLKLSRLRFVHYLWVVKGKRETILNLSWSMVNQNYRKDIEIKAYLENKKKKKTKKSTTQQCKWVAISAHKPLWL